MLGKRLIAGFHHCTKHKRCSKSVTPKHIIGVALSQLLRQWRSSGSAAMLVRLYTAFFQGLKQIRITRLLTDSNPSSHRGGENDWRQELRHFNKCCRSNTPVISKLFNTADDDFSQRVKTNSNHVLQPYLPQHTDTSCQLRTRRQNK